MKGVIIMISVYFDDVLKTRSGKIKPFWSVSYIEEGASDNQLVWFHERYGLMRLYRLLKVDDKNYIAEYAGRCICTNDSRWSDWLANPELALKS